MLFRSGCDSIIHLTLNFGIAPQVTITQNSIGCGSQSEVMVTATGNGPFNYTIEELSVFNATGIFQLNPGTYTATVTGADNCSVSESITVTGSGTCAQDFDNDLIVGVSDLQLFNVAYGCTGDCCPYDLNSDGAVSVADLLNFIAAFGVMCD